MRTIVTSVWLTLRMTLSDEADGDADLFEIRSRSLVPHSAARWHQRDANSSFGLLQFMSLPLDGVRDAYSRFGVEEFKILPLDGMNETPIRFLAVPSS